MNDEEWKLVVFATAGSISEPTFKKPSARLILSGLQSAFNEFLCFIQDGVRIVATPDSL